MAPLQPIFKKAYWSLVIAGGFYAVLLLGLTNVSLQRHALYAHKIHSGFIHNVSNPESFGFAKNQVTPFKVRTFDREDLYAWHILPIAQYKNNEGELYESRRPGISDNFTMTSAFRLLTEDPESRLVINFHGNAGHVAQGWRTDTYRSLTSLHPGNTHVISIDYRGFGQSSGSPTEAGLITDGISIVDFALNTLKIPPYRIVIVGQSLGTAVSTAVAHHYATEKGIDFAGIVLVAPFTSLPVLLETYRIFGIFPVLSPLRFYPKLSTWLTSHVQDTWNTGERISELAKVASAEGRKLHLHILHAIDDFDIPWRHGEKLYYLAKQTANDVLEGARGSGDVRQEAAVWGDDVLVTLNVLAHGGHNRVVTYSPVALAVMRAFEGKSVE